MSLTAFTTFFFAHHGIAYEETICKSFPLCRERIISAAYFGANEASNPELRSYCQRITGVDWGKMDTRKLSDRVKNHPSVNDSWSQLDKKIYQALQDNSSLV